jgi:hypothetical protein
MPAHSQNLPPAARSDPTPSLTPTQRQGYLAGQFARLNGDGIQLPAVQHARSGPDIPDPGRLPTGAYPDPYGTPRSRPATE